MTELWAELKAGDMLVLYQHQTNRNGQPWVERKKEQFERAIQLPAGAAGLARSEAIARDVVLFYAQKPAHQPLQPTSRADVAGRFGKIGGAARR